MGCRSYFLLVMVFVFALSAESPARANTKIRVGLPDFTSSSVPFEIARRMGYFAQKGLDTEYTCIDYSGWPIYTRAALPDDDADKICGALMARKDQIYREDSYTGIGPLGENTDATPRDVPLHSGAKNGTGSMGSRWES